MFGLFIMDIDNNNLDFSNSMSFDISEEFVLSSRRFVHYGSYNKTHLEIKVPMCINSQKSSFDSFDIGAIYKWLIGDNKYQKLVFSSKDLSDIYFMAIVKEIERITIGSDIIGVYVTFMCDSAGGYMFPISQSFDIDGNSDITVYNKGNSDNYDYPVISISNIGQSKSIKITSISDNGRTFEISDIADDIDSFTIDCKNQTLNAQSLYKTCNFNFPRLVSGENKFSISGNMHIDFYFSPKIYV